jgi:hypothetical protein
MFPSEVAVWPICKPERLEMCDPHNCNDKDRGIGWDVIAV